VFTCVWPAQAQTIRLKWVEAGAAARMSGVTPHSIDLSSTRPSQVKKIPPGVTNPSYGSFTIGPAEKPTHVDILLDIPPGKPSRLYVDVNGNGDFTDDPRPQWEAKPYTDSAGHRYTESIGSVTMRVQFGNTTLPMHLNLLRYDPSDPARAGMKGAVLYSPDYAREGQLQLGATAYHVMLMDALVGGDFRGTSGSGGAGIFLLIDVNGNGVFDNRGEMYGAGQPFNIGGVTYAIRNLTASGDSFALVKSPVQVPEIAPPPDLRIGKVAPAFTQKAMDGSTVRFPADYHGKLVLLSFWASDCGFCSTEMPDVVKAYQMFHAQGLDIVGISLDRANASSDIGKFTKQYGMHWPEIYDGRWMQAEIAQLYFVHLTPTLFLVDGTTGKVLASGADLRGNRLIQTVAVALTSHKK
jgi:peroxiredoxin